MINTITNICENCLRDSIKKGFIDTLLFNKTFKLVDTLDCSVGINAICANDGIPVCFNNCANWPWIDGRCGCECHE